MKLIRHNTALPYDTLITIGNFDAIHLGHQALIKQLTVEAKKQKLKSVLLTFSPLPAEFFSKTPPARLSSFREKWKQLSSFSLDYYACLNFNAKLASTSAEDFVKNILVTQLRMKQLIVGLDFRFGYQRQGDVSLLKTLGHHCGFEVTPFELITNEKIRVSSTLIRNQLQSGKLEDATSLLGRRYQISGHVCYGQQRGRQLGFPTANIHLKHPPALQGVFSVIVHGITASPLPGVANIGTRPTVDGKSKPNLEVHLLNYNGSLYGRLITIEFIKKIRNEQRFDSLIQLKNQIQNDIKVAQFDLAASGISLS